ncbi:hypothetical protein G6F55_014608 [Rhizopus delemar]|nr:hypothetical protein G6F55_014608 [Rhizopus delemar]
MGCAALSKRDVGGSGTAASPWLSEPGKTPPPVLPHGYDQFVIFLLNEPLIAEAKIFPVAQTQVCGAAPGRTGLMQCPV